MRKLFNVPVEWKELTTLKDELYRVSSSGATTTHTNTTTTHTKLHTKLHIILISTTGQGAFNPDFTPLLPWLYDPTSPNLPPASKWAVYAVGDRKYGQDFCRAGRVLYGKMCRIGEKGEVAKLGFGEGRRGAEGVKEWADKGGEGGKGGSVVDFLREVGGEACVIPPEVDGEEMSLEEDQESARKAEGLDGYYVVEPYRPEEEVRASGGKEEE